MQKDGRLLKICGRVIAIVILLSFLRFPVYGEQQTMQPPNLTENETRLYSEYELIRLIDELTEAAYEAIDMAAAEATRAAVIASIEREMAAMREAERWRIVAAAEKQSKVRTAIITGVICFLTGFATGTLIIGVTK